MSKNRLTELDCLRGIACLAVLLFHYTNFCHDQFGYFLNLTWGVTGVDLFFIISGFVIYMTLNKIKTVKDFAVSRFTRLFPVYWFAVLLTSFFLLITSTKDVSFIQILGNLTMVEDWFNIALIDNSYWTLLVELLFYVIIAVFFFLLPSVTVINKSILMLLVCILINVVSIYFNTGKGIIHEFPIVIFWNLFFSGMLFYKMKMESVKAYYHFVIIINIAFSYFTHDQGGTACFVTNKYEHIAFVILYHIIFYLYVYDKLSFIVNRALVFLGGISYSLYLIHQEVGFIIIKWLYGFEIATTLVILITVVAILLLATGMTYAVERPAQKILKNLLAKKTSPQQ